LLLRKIQTEIPARRPATLAAASSSVRTLACIASVARDRWSKPFFCELHPHAFPHAHEADQHRPVVACSGSAVLRAIWCARHHHASDASALRWLSGAAIVESPPQFGLPRILTPSHKQSAPSGSENKSGAIKRVTSRSLPERFQQTAGGRPFRDCFLALAGASAVAAAAWRVPSVGSTAARSWRDRALPSRPLEVNAHSDDDDHPFRRMATTCFDR
jgi:hypothetical protein